MVLSSLEDVEALINSNFEEDIYGSTDVTLDCLLPTGIYVQLCVDKWATVADVKQKLWKEARNLPMFALLDQPECCGFVYINSFGEKEEIQDEKKQISTIQPFMSVLKVIKRAQRTSETELNNKIGALIGKHDFGSLSDEEIREFRRKSRRMCESIQEEKSQVQDLNQMISFMYPPDTCSDENIWPRVSEALAANNHQFIIEIPHEYTNGRLGTHRLLMRADRYPDDVIADALQKRNQTQTYNPQQDVKDFVLKVVGREEYLIPNLDKPRPLYQYAYIYRQIMKQQNARLSIVKKSEVIRPVPRPRGGSNNAQGPPLVRRPRNIPHADLWDIGEKFSVKAQGAINLNCDDDTLVHLKAAIYHGVDMVCNMQETCEVAVKDNNANFNYNLEFDLAVCDLPRMSRLCLALYTRTDRRGRRQKTSTNKEATPAAWVNMCIFNFQARLNCGDITLCMWPYDESTVSSDHQIHHLGTVVSNPQSQNSVSLSLKLKDYGHNDKPTVYPSMETIIDCAARQLDSDNEYGTIGKYAKTEDEARKQLAELLDNRDPLVPFDEEDKEQIWAMRMDISSDYRDCLPKLLSCVRWNSHEEVAQMQTLLQTWPTIDVDTALELLDCMYPDCNVRAYAVKCLKSSITDTELCRYLLQLVQALKFESYLDCDLVHFLLERAIRNRKLGHYLFWLLKSEMHVPSVSVRFGLILEAYCRGSVDHVAVLTKQMDIVTKLLVINRLVKDPALVKDEGLKTMRNILTTFTEAAEFTQPSSPLNPALRLSELKVEKCKYMDSKMKPLFLVWSNGDKFGEDIKIIFKNGDDLRQDMLTLQVLQIMDNIWISQGLDLRMIPYECLSTGRDVGMLEVVQNAETVANIQKKFASVRLKSAFNKESMYKWLEQHNPDKESLKKAVNDFTLSCAGYCVASYVLGIGDRHSDNIMLKQTGQLFHIDFGHFLGNFKFKYGIKRERVPFVLTHDFVYIIMKADRPKPFDHFKELCEQAYLLLRKKGNLLVSLFMMMLSTGIPELKSVSDLKYLQDTLKLDLSEEAALKHFRGKFKEALNNSWKTSVNWALHNAARNNA